MRYANPALQPSQRYVGSELRELYKCAQINTPETPFWGALVTAVLKELARLKVNAIQVKLLLRRRHKLYFQHDMDKWTNRQQLTAQNTLIPRIICSEELG